MATGCNSAQTAAPPQALQAVSPLPKPAPPDWIKAFSPTGEAQTLAQVRVIFSSPLIPLQAIDTPDEQKLLQYFVIDPQLPGHFRFLTPRMVGFEQDAAWPIATRVRVRLKAGLKDLHGRTLPHDLAWTFTTAPIGIKQLPGQDPEQNVAPSGLKPTWRIFSNVELNLDSLRSHAELERKSTKERSDLTIEPVPLSSAAPNDEDRPQNEYDPATRTWAYDVTPTFAMAKSSDYLVRIRPGVAPARGNLPSAQAFLGRVTTFSPLAFQGLNYGRYNSRFASGLARLDFNNPLQADSVRRNITISPKPPHSNSMWMVSDGDAAVGINPGWLTPQTTYTITMRAGIRDSFGQMLGAPAMVRYNTGDFTPNLWAPDGFNIFPSDDDLQLNISAVNLPENRYQRTFRTIAPEELINYDSAYPYADGHGLLPGHGDWPSATLRARLNEVVDVAVPVRTLLHGRSGMLAYGVQAFTGAQVSDPYQRYFGLLQLTNLGVFAQWFPSSGLVRVHHLSDGSPVGGARVEVFISQVDAVNRKATSAPCTSGLTDGSGSLWVLADAMHRCSMNADPNQAPKLLAIAHENADWAFARNDVWSGAYGYGFDAGWQRSAPDSRGTIYSDRQLYQPGETGSFTTVAYYLKDGELWQDRNSRYRVTLIGPNDQRTVLGTHTTNRYGTFSFNTTFKPDQPLGDYQLEAKSGSGVVLTGDVRIAEFKPPNFKVELHLDKPVAFANDTVNAKGRGAYLFGASLQGGNVQYYVTRAQTSYTPKGWDAYAFGRQWFWPEQAPSVQGDVVQVRGKLDGNGSYSQGVTVPTDLPFAMRYQVDLQVSDVSNLSVADSKSFTALPSDALIGMQGDWVAAAGQPATYRIVVTDSNGTPLTGRRVRVQLDEMHYSSAAQVIENGEAQQYQVRYTTVATADVASTSAPQTVTLTAPEAGAYRVRANLAGAASDASATDLMLWATGRGEVSWANQDHDHVQIKLDKTTYRAGEMATALVQSPYPRAELY
ncbi:MAG: MG2 domain-containing protein, partial [Candidatus Eremiobacteraeota bacterium]|nr:MG2 domain-containing protein [Candidatus Eremiobacteraeota bacterium]